MEIINRVNGTYVGGTVKALERKNEVELEAAGAQKNERPKLLMAQRRVRAASKMTSLYIAICRAPPGYR